MEDHRLAVLYEHPDWFKPLFAELDRRSVRYVRLHAEELLYDPAIRSYPYPLVLNRMSPSSYLRGHAQGIFRSWGHRISGERPEWAALFLRCERAFQLRDGCGPPAGFQSARKIG